MRNRIINAIKRVASDDYINKYVINGTEEEYAIPEEVVDQACSETESVFRVHVLERLFSSKELEVLKHFASVGRGIEAKLPYADYATANVSITTSELWKELQKEAQHCLLSLGVTDFNGNID